jgi:hypothetical protein
LGFWTELHEAEVGGDFLKSAENSAVKIILFNTQQK